MKLHQTILGLFLITILAYSCKNSQPTTPPPLIPMKDFFRNPEKSGYQISPDGQYFSFRAPWKNRMNIFVQKVGDSAITQVTTDTIKDINAYFWKGDRLLYSRDINGDENYIVFSASRDGKDVKRLSPEKGVRAQILDNLQDIPGMEKKVLLIMNQRNPQVFDPYLCDIETGKIDVLYDNSKDNFENWVTDHNGVIRFAVKTDGTDNVYYYRATDKDPFNEYMRTGYKDSWSPLLFTFDNKNLIVSHNLSGRDKTAIVEWDLTAKKETKLLHDNPDYDVTNVDWSRKRKVITMYQWQGVNSEKKIVDDKTKQLYNKLEGKFPGYEISIVSENDDETKRTIWVGSDRVTGRFYYHEDGKEEITLLCDRTPWIKEEQMAEMKPIKYTSRDGLTINGYLTLPLGREAKNLPVVINPHGGPWYRDGWGFNPEVQFLANRGYAVLQMDFRGSTGYGRKHWEASFRQWGKKMQDDITDGVNWLIKEGIADSNRIAIYGGSYGGYATLAGITFTPNLYACAIDYVGVSNLFTFMNTFPPYWESFRKQMYEMVGDPNKDSILLREASPVFHVDKIKCPLFISQGANDPRVNKAESDQMVEALKKRGIQVQYMVKDNEGHGFSREENQFDFYGAMEKFLDQHIGSGYQKSGTK
jgi:dipeptidyl aminopeptidase/acylaminoacyl peptidase